MRSTKILGGMSEGNRLIWISRRRWEDNTKKDFQVVCEGVDWIHLPQDRVQWQAVGQYLLNIRVAMKAGYFLIR
jgi:hypothetical protein